MPRKSKVVHLTTVHHPFDPRIYHKECKSLADAGFDVSLIVSDHDDLMDHIDEKVKLIKIKRSSNRFIRMVKSSYDAYKAAKKLYADVYHFHDPELIFIAWLLKNKNNIVIYDVHEDYETSIRQKKYLPKGFANLLAAFYRGLEKTLTRRFEICLAEKYYSEKFPQGTHILNYPILKEVNETINTEAKQKEEDTFNLIYTGNVTLDRGALIHAELPKLDERIRVNYVGKCPSALAEKIYEIAEDKKEHVLIEGVDKFVPREIIDRYYQDKNWIAGIALFPPTEHYLKKELTKFFEYMNAGIPILCSNFPVWKQFIEKYKCGIAVDPFNHNDIINAIRYLAENPEEARAMGERGKAAVQKELNWTAEKEKLINWYDQLLYSKSMH